MMSDGTILLYSRQTVNGTLDIGFAQIVMLQHQTAKCKYLSTITNTYEVIIYGSYPMEVAPFRCLSIPFDTVTWACVVGAAAAVSLLLFTIEISWSAAQRESPPIKLDGKYG